MWWSGLLSLLGLLAAIGLTAGILYGCYVLVMHDKSIAGIAGIVTVVTGLVVAFLGRGRSTPPE